MGGVPTRVYRIQTCLDFYIFFIFTRPLTEWKQLDKMVGTNVKCANFPTWSNLILKP